MYYLFVWGFPGFSDGKESACNAGDPYLIPGLVRSPVEGNGNPLQYSCLENLMAGWAWWATVCAVAKSQAQVNTFTSFICLEHVAYLVNKSFDP